MKAASGTVTFQVLRTIGRNDPATSVEVLGPGFWSVLIGSTLSCHSTLVLEDHKCHVNHTHPPSSLTLPSLGHLRQKEEVISLSRKG